MKYLPAIAGALLGAMFFMASVPVLFGNPTMPEFPEGTPIAHFMAAFGPTGYTKFIKVFELLGGILVAIPKTRNFGLIFLCPVIVNIVAFHIFITNGEGLTNWMLDAIIVLALYLLWDARHKIAALRN